MGLQMNKMPPTEKIKCVGGLPYNYFLFIANQELQIPFNKWPSDMPQL
jgi:hypothetical protein